MPAFSHCFLKRFIAFSNDSPSLTRTPGILGITTLREAHQYPGFWERGSIRPVGGLSTRRRSTRLGLAPGSLAETVRQHSEQVGRHPDLAASCKRRQGGGALLLQVLAGHGKFRSLARGLPERVQLGPDRRAHRLGASAGTRVELERVAGGDSSGTEDGVDPSSIRILLEVGKVVEEQRDAKQTHAEIV